MFALMLIPLLLAVGAALDYGLASSAKSRAQSASDSAVLAGVKRAARAKADGDNNWKVLGESDIKNFFAINTKGMEFEFAPTLEAVIKEVDGALNGTLTYNFKRPTVLIGLAGIKEIPISGSSIASTALGTYIDINFIIDNSGSMGIGAELSDQLKMFNKTGCAFACHVPRGAGEAAYTPQAAAAAGAKLRIDVARGAMLKVISDLRAMNLPGDAVRVSLRTFSIRPQVLLAATSNLNNAVTAINQLELARDNATPVGGTYVKSSLDTIAAQLGSGGTGLTATNRKSYVVLFTDGIEDSIVTRRDAGTYFHNLWSGNRYELQTGWDSNNPNADLFVAGEGSTMLPFDGNACKPFKDKNHTMMPLRIKYVPPYGYSAWYDVQKITFVLSQDSAMSQNFKKCASDPSTVVTASSSGEIEPALRGILTSIIRSSGLRITS